MQRLRPEIQGRPALALLPFYVLHVPWQKTREELMFKGLASRHVGVLDVTVVLCANGGDIQALSPTNRVCLHPYMAYTRWNKESDRLANGTLSLAVKHMLACYDMLVRHLPAAVVLENDATFIKSFNQHVVSLLARVPLDAQLLYLGSYTQGPTSANNEFVHLPFAEGQNLSARTELLLHVRRNSSSIVGTVAYVVFERGARWLIQPQIAPADIMMSYQQPPINAPEPVYGPNHYIVRQLSRMETGLLPKSERGGTHS